MRPIFRFSAILPMAVLCQLSLATEGPHINEDRLRDLIDEVVDATEPRTVEVVREVPVETVREVPVQPDVRQALSFTLAGDDSDGCDVPSVALGYELETQLDAVNLDAHGRVWTGGNLACKDASSADVQVRGQFGSAVVTVGYDRRAVSVQEVDPVAGRVVFYGASVAETAALGYAIGPVTVGWNVLQSAPRVAYEADLPYGITFEADGQRFPSTGTVAGFRFSWSHELAGAWDVTAHAGMTSGLANAPDPVSWRNDAGLMRGPSNPPDTAYFYGAGLKRRF